MRWCIHHDSYPNQGLFSFGQRPSHPHHYATPLRRAYQIEKARARYAVSIRAKFL